MRGDETSYAMEIKPTETFDGEDSSSDLSAACEEGCQTTSADSSDTRESLQETATTIPTETHETPKNALTCIKIGIDWFKYTYSTLILLLSVFLVMAAIFSTQTVGTADIGVHPVVAFFVFWFLVCWLAMMEGGQGCLVGLNPVDKEAYQSTHALSFKNTALAHKGDNMERFIVGRQFLVVLAVFVSNMMSSAVPDVDILGLPQGLQSTFLTSGFALIFVAITIGQLAAQINAATCMLDLINNYFMLYFVTYASLIIEFSGLLHCVYLIQILFAKLAGKPVESKEPPRSKVQQAFFWGRVLVSLSILAFALAVTLSALFAGKTTMWDGVPPMVSVIVFVVLMGFAGLMEGMQIALFAVVNLPEEELEQHPMARKSCQLAFRGQNLQAFLIGRQILVTVCMFVVAQIVTLDVEVGVDDNIFGVSDGWQNFFNTGLLGAVITTIVASLAWRVIASSFPVPFLSNPLVYMILRLCLELEASGLCSVAWLLASVQRKVCGYQPDQVYLHKKPEESTLKTVEV